MDKLALLLVNLLRELLAGQEKLLAIANKRHEAMKCYDVETMNKLLEREAVEVAAMEVLEKNRRTLIAKFRAEMEISADPTVSMIAERVAEPTRTQLIVLAGKVRSVVEQLERINRINAKVSQGVVKSIAKVLKIITGIAQHAGLYMANGRKAALKGIHLLDAVG